MRQQDWYMLEVLMQFWYLSENAGRVTQSSTKQVIMVMLELLCS